MSGFDGILIEMAACACHHITARVPRQRWLGTQRGRLDIRTFTISGKESVLGCSSHSTIFKECPGACLARYTVGTESGQGTESRATTEKLSETNESLPAPIPGKLKLLKASTTDERRSCMIPMYSNLLPTSCRGSASSTANATVLPEWNRLRSSN